MEAIADCNPVLIPSHTNAIGLDTCGDSFNEPRKYSTALGRLMQLDSNYRTNTAFYVHQCAYLIDAPRKPYAKSVKRIIRYIKGTSDKGLILEPSYNL